MDDAHMNDNGVLVLGPELTIAFASQWREALLDALATSKGDLRVDLAGVSDFDSSGVQLLLASTRSLAARGHALVITQAADAVRDALATFGLRALLPAAATPTPGD